MSYLFKKISFKEKKLFYFHKKIKNLLKPKKTIFSGFFGVFFVFGGFFIANPGPRRSAGCTSSLRRATPSSRC